MQNKDFRTSIGGQALIEGIMMRGPKKQAIVVRRPDGELETKVEDIKLLKEKHPLVGLPLIRGAVNFIATMAIGVRAMMFSASFIPDEDEAELDDDAEFAPQPTEEELAAAKAKAEKSDKMLVTVSILLGTLLSVGLFMLLPAFLSGLLKPFLGAGLWLNIAEGVIRIAIFVLYLWLASHLNEMKRVWEYHGAEHKTIFCYEKSLPLTVENVRIQPRRHPRCGTSFLFIVMIVSILVFSVAQWGNMWLRLGMRLVLLPVVVGVSYEIIKWAGRNDNIVTRIVSAPGKAFQRLTTREPDDGMIEVAIAALTLVLPDNAEEATW
ncbi:MAG: DUF1385 domain-containing protein [Oscillospiraceae bacterium]|jgi:uncharacterized protein YqhQ|nr:DUF1385 domain-containing protein [Oscillospiraceae bacterium]